MSLGRKAARMAVPQSWIDVNFGQSSPHVHAANLTGHNSACVVKHEIAIGLGPHAYTFGNALRLWYLSSAVPHGHDLLKLCYSTRDG